MVASRRTRAPAEKTVDYAALADFRYAIRKFLAFSETAATEAGLTSQQHQALLTIKGLGDGNGATIGELAKRLLLRPHSAVELVDRLETAELVQRHSDPTDGRRVIVSLTREGENWLGNLSSAHLVEIKSIGPTLVSILESLQASSAGKARKRR
jgi:DNA-binding MarR family transcriptional regulator